MSWRSGSQLFREMWPLLQARIPNLTARREFLNRILVVFLESDLDPEAITDLHPEVRQALADLGVQTQNPPAQDDVLPCVIQLRSPVEKDRITAAQAIEFFVHQAPDSTQAAESALCALADALRDTSVKVRRATAKSIETLVADGFALPSQARKSLEKAVSEQDEVVKKRMAKVLNQSPPNKRQSKRRKS